MNKIALLTSVIFYSLACQVFTVSAREVCESETIDNIINISDSGSTDALDNGISLRLGSISHISGELNIRSIAVGDPTVVKASATNDGVIFLTTVGVGKTNLLIIDEKSKIFDVNVRVVDCDNVTSQENRLHQIKIEEYAAAYQESQITIEQLQNEILQLQELSNQVDDKTEEIKVLNDEVQVLKSEILSLKKAREVNNSVKKQVKKGITLYKGSGDTSFMCIQNC